MRALLCGEAAAFGLSATESMAEEYYEDYYYDGPANPALATGPAPAASPPAKAYTLPELDDDEKACMALLRGVPIFAHLSDEGLHTMAANSTVRHFQKGSPIIAQGSRSSDVYVILSGKMEVTEEVKEVPVSAEAAAAAQDPGPKDPGDKPSKRLAHAKLLAPEPPAPGAEPGGEPGAQPGAEAAAGAEEAAPKEPSYALWIDAEGLAEADALWAKRKKAAEDHRRSKQQGSVQKLMEAPEQFRRLVERSGEGEGSG